MHMTLEELLEDHLEEKDVLSVLEHHHLELVLILVAQ